MKLTKDNREILRMLCYGKTSHEICARFGCSLSTLRVRISYMKQQNGCHTREELVARFAREEL